MGGIYCLPVSAEQPALASQPDLANDMWSPLVLTQDNLEGDDLADRPNKVLTTLEAVAFFQQDLEAQGTELGLGIMTGQNANDGAHKATTGAPTSELRRLAPPRTAMPPPI
jgi:hypothetical protein